MSHADPTTRGHRGLIAVAIVIGSGVLVWFAAVALARASARARIAEEIERARRSDPVSFLEMVAPGQAPPANENGMTLLLDRDERYASALERARAAAELPVIWFEHPSAGAMSVAHVPERNAFDAALASLSSASIAAARSGDDASALADVRRLMRIRELLERQQLTSHQYEVTQHSAFALAAALASKTARRACLELDPLFAAIEPARNVVRSVRWNRRHFVYLVQNEEYSPGLIVRRARDADERVWSWPMSTLALADEIAELNRFDELAALGLRAVIAAPGFEWRTPEPLSCLPSPPDWRDFMCAVPSAAREQALVTLVRAALRARFDGAADAEAFLAQHADPFTGGKLHARVVDDGTWTAWCTGTVGAPASPYGPDPRYDLVWPPNE